MHRVVALVTCLVAITAGFRLRSGNQEPPQPRHLRQPLFHALIYTDGRPVEVLVDNLGSASADSKFQTGDKVPQSELPHFIGAYGELSQGEGGAVGYQIYCTASLIDPTNVLIAAHCAKEQNRDGIQEIFVPGLTNVKVQTLEDFYRVQKHMTYASKIHVHPKYDADAITDDIAIVTLKEPVKIEGVEPICLGGTDSHGDDIIGAGWGQKDCYEVSQDSLREAFGTIYPIDKCMEERDANPDNICVTFVTANGEKAGAAPGDSGGPLYSNTDPENPVQVGIASKVYGDKTDDGGFCTDKTAPQIYVRVSSYQDFINGIATEAQWC